MEKVFQKAWPEKYVPSVREVSEVKATALGPILKGAKLIMDTTYRYPYALLKAYGISIASSFARPSKTLSDENIPAFIHSQWSRGYYHWITESLPRAMAVHAARPDAKIYIPQSYNSFHIESLELLGFEALHFTAHNVNAKNALVTSCPQHLGTTSRELIADLGTRLKDRSPSDVTFGKRIYISRQNARGRKVANEEEVIKALKPHGFTSLQPEDFTFADQVSIFRDAEFVIGIHGAGLTNMIFMQSAGRIIELLPFRNGIFDFRPNTMSMKHDNCYRTLAAQMSLSYDFLQCAHDKQWYERTNLADLLVDCSELVRLINAERHSRP